MNHHVSTLCTTNIKMNMFSISDTDVESEHWLRNRSNYCTVSLLVFFQLDGVYCLHPTLQGTGL